MSSKPSQTSEKLLALIQTVHRLRAPGGCPWDREQTHQSLRQYLIEEAYEALDILDQVDSPDRFKDERIRGALREELGDVLLQVLLHSEMANEVGAFDVADVADALNEKLIRRHPHVFGEAQVKDSDGVVANWEKIKSAEKAAKAQGGIPSVLDGMPKGLPALQRAARTVEKVSKVGFQWDDLRGPLDKIDEELRELRAEIAVWEKSKTPEAQERLQEELGDLLFTICNIAYLTKSSPEDALRGTISRFERRFRHVEKRLHEQGKTPGQSNLDEMDRYWNEAKAQEK